MKKRATQSELQTEFEQAAFAHFDAMHGLAMRLTRSTSEAEDLVQSTLLRAWRFYDSFEPGTNLRAWLLKILMNGFINQYRRGVRQRSALEASDQLLSSQRAMSSEAMRALLDPESQALRAVLARELEQAVDSLSDDYRAVVLLADVEELTYKEIAEVLGCPIGTVMSRLHRGRRLLQQRLAEGGGKLESEPRTTHGAGPAHDAPLSLESYRRKRAAR